MRVLVCGGREYADPDALAAFLADLRQARGITVLIAGGARGADTLAEEWAKAQGIRCEVYMADWEGLGRKAGPIRNQQMLDEGKPELVVAFPGGRGTADMVRRAREAGVENRQLGASVPLAAWPGHVGAHVSRLAFPPGPHHPHRRLLEDV